VIAATVSSFYVPLVIMTVMYALTVRALRRQVREQRTMTVNQLGVYATAAAAAGGTHQAGPDARAQIWNATAAASPSDTGINYTTTV